MRGLSLPQDGPQPWAPACPSPTGRRPRSCPAEARSRSRGSPSGCRGGASSAVAARSVASAGRPGQPCPRLQQCCLRGRGAQGVSRRAGRSGNSPRELLGPLGPWGLFPSVFCGIKVHSLQRRTRAPSEYLLSRLREDDGLPDPRAVSRRVGSSHLPQPHCSPGLYRALLPLCPPQELVRLHREQERELLGAGRK